MSSHSPVDISGPSAAPASSLRFRVTLNCPTPVAHPELEVEAETESAAWQQFCAANGITDSVHERMVVEL